MHIPKKILFLLLFTSWSIFSFSQSSQISEGSKTHRILDRLISKYGSTSSIHSSLKNYSRKDVVDFVLDLYQKQTLSPREIENIQYILDDNNDILENFNINIPDKEVELQHPNSKNLIYKKQDPILKYFYKTPANFLELNEKDFSLRINPILNLKLGKDIDDNDQLIFQNTRGIEIRGLIDNKVYFYTNLIENQGSFNNYILERINKYKAIPGHGSYKGFQSSLFDAFEGFDFPNSQAYVGLPISKHIGLEFGHSRHFIGNGYHSLLLSDYAQNYFYLKLSTKIWKLHYQNIFAELAPISANLNPANTLLAKKYMANHYLSFKHNKFEIGLFETVMFSRQDHFEFQYINPIIFYRTIEFFLDSPDNVLLGLNVNWTPINGITLYGQVILDEFKLNELLDRSGWWANKYGFQLGIKYFDVLGIENLSAQVEYNIVRPYTYSHRDSIDGFNISVANYSHFNQPLAHPLGANFKEALVLINYDPSSKISISTRIMYASYGDDPDGKNWGGDILKPVLTFEKEYDNFIGQGINTKVFQLGLDLSYQFFHNYNIDLHYLYRQKNSEVDNLDLNTNYLGAGIRANIGNLKLDY